MAASLDPTWHRKRCKSGEGRSGRALGGRPRVFGRQAPARAPVALIAPGVGRYVDEVTASDLQALFHLVSGRGLSRG